MLRSVGRGLAWIAESPARRVARYVLPERLKTRLIGLVLAADAIVPQVQQPGALSESPPLLPPHAFNARHVVLINSALAWGGAERQVVNLLLGLNERGLNAELICLRLGDTPDHDFYRAALGGISARNAMSSMQARRILREWPRAQRQRIKALIAGLPHSVGAETLRLLAEFLRIRPGVVHAWQDGASIAAGFAARIAGVPRIVLSSRNVNPSHFAYHRSYMSTAYQQLISCPEIAFVNNSAFGCRDYAGWLQVGADRFRVHRNGIDVSHLQEPDPIRVAALARTLGVPSSAPVVGSIFRFYLEKQPLLWLEMAASVRAQMPEVHFVVFGVGPLKKEFERRAESLGLAGQMHCPGTTTDPALALQLFDVFVLASKHEGTPNVVLEASTLGVPVVLTSAGGAAESILPGQTGLLSEDNDPNELAGLVLQVLSDDDWKTRAKSSGPAFVQHKFGLQRMIDEALALYDLHLGAR
ncbi:MAG: glycosyltransferase [Xanthobacteraceae bacterium]